MNARKRIIIAGAGVAGLTLAYLLCRDGHDVLLAEKEDEVGGLARSFEYDGFTFDVGPHRFHSEFADVMSFVSEVLEDDSLLIERKSGVWMFGKYFEWPLSFSSLFRMPLSVLLSVAGDFAAGKRQEGSSFEDYILSNYGRTLYEIFFRPYTEKFLRIPCREISREWAVTGIDRAVIDRKTKVNDIRALATSLLFPKPRLNFVYPRSGGIGVFSRRLAGKITESGGRLLSGSGVSGVVSAGNRIRQVIIGDTPYECDSLVWTAPITEISRLLGHGAAGLDYRSLLLFNYRVGGSPKARYQWCYYGSDDVPFNRVSVPSLFNPSLAPPGKTGLCVEVTCGRDEDAWHDPERLEGGIRESLAAVGCIGATRDILGYNIEKIPDAYPVYTLRYRDNLDKVTEMLGASENLRLLGRSGTYWYNNMDNSIAAAFSLYRSMSHSLR